VTALSVVVPVWNEEGSIGRLIEELSRALPEHELIVVDDASTDGTQQILERLRKLHPALRVEQLERNSGHGPAVTHGIGLASNEWVFVLDSDRQIPVAEFERLWAGRDSAAVVLGVRTKRRDPLHRRVGSRLVAALASLLAGRRLRDPNVPFRLFRRELWEELRHALPAAPRAPMLALSVGAAARGKSVAQVPVFHRARSSGRPSLAGLRLMRFGLRAVAELARFRLRLAGPDALAYAGIFLLALGLRLPHLANRPLHHDESIHAWLSWRLATGHGYEYDPAFHGPLQIYAMALLFLVFHASDAFARLGPALAGSALTVLPIFLRRQLGSVAALAMAFLLCISPTFLYFSRFAREDMYFVTLTLALVIVTFRFVDAPGPRRPIVMLALLAALFATKESAYIVAFVFGTFFAGALVVEAVRGGGPVVRALRSAGLAPWVWGAAVFVFLFALLFSTFFTRPEGFRTAVGHSLGYWLSQQPVNRGGEPWYFYFVLVPAYEWPIVLLGLVGIVDALRRPSLFRAFLVYAFAVELIVYSWASERLPWLALHPLLPLIALAGIGVEALWNAERRVVLVAAPVLGAALLYGGISATYRAPADPAEMFVATQTSRDIDPVLATITRISREASPKIEVDSSEGADWPWAWYLRNVPVGYPDMSAPGFHPTGDVVIATEADSAPFRGYRARAFRLREWWVRDYARLSPRTAVRWFAGRRPWNELGSFNETMYIRRGLNR
jgi:uncharacterized protein (TIGR03663 family)